MTPRTALIILLSPAWAPLLIFGTALLALALGTEWVLEYWARGGDCTPGCRRRRWENFWHE